MGINYYVQPPPCPHPCQHCSRPEQIHLGKASPGWRFLFRADPAWPRSDAYRRWLERAKSGRIVDEYGVECALGDLLRMVRSKQSERNHALVVLPPWVPDEVRRSIGASYFVTREGFDFCDREFC